MKYEYQRKNVDLDFEEGVKLLKQRLKNKVTVGVINNTDPDIIESECNELKKIGIPVEKFKIDKKEYLQYLREAGYKNKYPDYYKDNFNEKTFEHFLCYKFIRLRKGDNLVDIASEYSPLSEIFQRLTGCNSYSQDIMYKPGIQGNKIGSDAGNIPVPDNFFNAAIATCSLEHFENDSDIRFMKEMERVLVKGGKVLVVPLCLYPRESCQTDPRYSYQDVKFDDEADIYCAENWGNRHGRYYSPLSLFKRLIEPNKKIDFKVYLLDNPQELDNSIYCRFILIGTKLMKIAIVAPSPVPFAAGGVEGLASELAHSINKYSKHQCELIKLPSKELSFWELIDSYKQFYHLELSHFDMVISIKYPAWMVRHKNHICYMAHRLRGLYDTYSGSTDLDYKGNNILVKKILALTESREYSDENVTLLFSLLDDLRKCDDSSVKDLLIFPGPFIRKIIHFMDNAGLSKNKIRDFFSISNTVKNRLEYFPENANVETVYVPSPLTGLHCNSYDYLFTVSRLDSPKRIDLLINSMKHVSSEIKFKIAGTGPQEEYLKTLAKNDPRIEFLGFVKDEALVELYSNALAVLFTPYQEDLGLITIEAMMSKKPVITTKDSGGTLEFVKDFETGLVAEPEACSVAEKINYFIGNKDAARQMGEKGFEAVISITWESTVNKLLSRRMDKKSIVQVSWKKKILVLSTYSIYPPRNGGQSRLYNLYKKLSRKFDVTVLSLIEFGRNPSDDILEGGLRNICIIQSEKHARLQWDVEKRLDLGLFDVMCIENAVHSAEYVEKVKKFSKNSDVVVCSHPYLFNLIGKNNGQAIFYDAIDIEYIQKEPYLKKGKNENNLVEIVRDIEKRACMESDGIFATSHEERKSLSELYEVPVDKIFIIPNGVDIKRIPFFTKEEKKEQKQLLGLSNYTTVLFVGSWHPPNLEALKFIVDTLAPQRKDCLFMIVGSINDYYKQQSLEKYPDNVLGFGIVDEPEKIELYRASDIAINPMTSGSGTNLKMLDYMASGIPVISTPIGARGLETEGNVIVSELENFSENIDKIISGGINTQQMCENAKRTVDRIYDWDRISRYAGQIINSII